MKRILFMMIGATALLMLMAGCETTTSTSTQDEARSMLVASGFKMVSPKNPAQQQKLQQLQTGHVATIQKDGKTYYLVADPSRNVVYVGGPTEYQAYQHLRAQRHLAQETAETEEMYEDEEMDWGGWGGWGLGWGRMGYGPRLGRVGIY